MSQSEKQSIAMTPQPFLRPWFQRLKFDSYGLYIFIVIFNIIQMGLYFYLVTLQRCLDNRSYLIYSIAVLVFVISWYIQKKIPAMINTYLDENVNLFTNEDTNIEYRKKVQSIFNNPKMVVLAGILAMIFGSLTIIEHASHGYTYHSIGNEKLYFVDSMRILFIIQNCLAAVFYFVIGVMGLQAIIYLNYLFQIVNLLGSDEFPLKMTYLNIKAGFFHEIGKKIISITIIPILLCTFIGIVGLLFLKLFEEPYQRNKGYGMIFCGILFATFLLFLLYRNTIHIHKSIVKYKSDLKIQITTDVQRNIENVPINYDNIYKIHAFGKEIDKISDWPYDPKSLRKLAISMTSSVIPLIISAFGLN